ncbi:hypothetical protein GLAREA_04106 [Glarea lozoyensis ATCC 20868]|uniref:F-box domain-containing protein n=1 Tax=Glarea lozoyensis (strain ATCC 20868 / MF5171) TaxID=1116229 RepID=S3D1U2_GLAL2|nr:uncharacterized protein GLAREA_04106 [Glarea lozoyensis ATCC 20868]EPE31139.1 hypothetical protein GLAREA_04106 [Glarea lozoyensis ATCC 20868]
MPAIADSSTMNLPVEVLVLVLKEISDVGSLWSFIRTSSHIYRIFQEQQASILPLVISREVGPQLMGEALAALRSSRLVSYDEPQGNNSWIPRRGPSKSEAFAWIMEYENVINREDVPPPSTEDTLSLWDLHKDVKFLADLYVGEALDIFDQAYIGQKPRDAKIRYTLNDLSHIEQQRLFRPIYRVVIFRNLFGPYADPASDEEQSEYFLCRFPSWQVEEISCVNDFIRDEILRKWHELEDYVFQRVSAGMGLQDAAEFVDGWEREFFSQDRKQVYFQGQQAVSIKCLRRLFEAKDNVLEALVRQFEPPDDLGCSLLEDALLVDPAHFPVELEGDDFRGDAYMDYRAGDAPWFTKEDFSSFNIFWQWSNQCDPRIGIYYDSTSAYPDKSPDLEGFRRVGYVFWDQVRSENMHNSWPCSRGSGVKIMEDFPRPQLEDQDVGMIEKLKYLKASGDEQEFSNSEIVS